MLAITSIPLECRVEGPNKLHFRIGAKVSPAQQIEELKEFVARHPTNVQARVELAKLIADTQDRAAGVAELRKLANEFSNVSQIHHDLAHQLEKLGDVPGALLSFQCALDLKAGDYRNYRCYGKCLHRYALTLSYAVVKRSSLDKAQRLLERAAVIGGQAKQQEIQGDLFVVEEALKDLPTTGNG